VSADAEIGDSTVVWGLAQVREGAVLGVECVVGRGAYIGAGVRIGDRVKVQNLAQVYEPAVVGDGVFIGPGAILTNDEYPRAVRPDGSRVDAAHWQPVGVTLQRGSSIGAGAVCVAPVVV
jgi:UDP-3-O-[3-hydroxymyristoyl] glucosamine N-acyltransferase